MQPTFWKRLRRIAQETCLSLANLRRTNAAQARIHQHQSPPKDFSEYLLRVILKHHILDTTHDRKSFILDTEQILRIATWAGINSKSWIRSKESSDQKSP